LGVGVAQKIDDRYVTRNNLRKNRDLALQVFYVGSKLTCNAKAAQKIIGGPINIIIRHQLLS